MLDVALRERLQWSSWFNHLGSEELLRRVQGITSKIHGSTKHSGLVESVPMVLFLAASKISQSLSSAESGSDSSARLEFCWISLMVAIRQDKW